MSPPRRNKYGAIKVEIDGHVFASQAEGRRYEELRLLELAGVIRSLVVHPRFPLYAPVLREDRPPIDTERQPAWINLCDGEYGPSCRAKRIGFYEADFAYEVYGGHGAAVVEDVKGVKTPVYRLKKKLMLAIYGVDVVEVQA